MPMKILFLSRWFPYPANNGSRIRIFNIIREMSKIHAVDLLSFVDEQHTPANVDAMRAFCQDIDVVRYVPFSPTRGKALLGYLSPRPRSVIDTYSKEMENKLMAMEQKRHYDLLIASQIDMAVYGLKSTIKHRLLEELELTVLHDETKRQSSLVRKMRMQLTWAKTSSYCAMLASQYGRITVVSEPEKEKVECVCRGEGKIQIIPNGVDVSHYDYAGSQPEDHSMIYSGALSYSLNYDAVRYFVSEILPLIQSKYPDATLTITGSTSNIDLSPFINCPGVNFSGYLDDVRSAIRTSRVAVIPLLVGGGTRLKVLEAMALGTPVVSTSKGVEGLEVEHGEHLLIANNPEEFADALHSIFSDHNLANRLRMNARRLVEEKYDWTIIGACLNQLISGMVNESPR